MRRREQERQQRRAGFTRHQTDIASLSRIEHRHEVVDMRLEWRRVTGREAIGESHAAAVHGDHPRESADPSVRIRDLGDPPVLVEVREEAGHEQHVDRSRPEHLERDERPIRDTRVAGLGDVDHAGTS